MTKALPRPKDRTRELTTMGAVVRSMPRERVTLEIATGILEMLAIDARPDDAASWNLYQEARAEFAARFSEGSLP
jgi:hypothetical protein